MVKLQEQSHKFKWKKSILGKNPELRRNIDKLIRDLCVPTAGRLAENGALKVNDYLQVDGFSNVFAVGDCADINEPKMAYHADLHANVAVNNISNSLSGKELTSYSTGTHTHTPAWLAVAGSTMVFVLPVAR